MSKQKRPIYTSAAHLTEKTITAYLGVINPYLQKPHLFNIIKGNC